jgi:hypothetical protein
MWCLSVRTTLFNYIQESFPEVTFSDITETWWIVSIGLKKKNFLISYAKGTTESYRGADKSLARPGRKQATVTKLLTSASQSKQIQKVVRPTRSQRQQWPPRWMKNGDPSIVFQLGRAKDLSAPLYYQHFHSYVTWHSLKCENWASVQYFISAQTCTMKPLATVSKGSVIKNDKKA